jgi:uncharacterized membrane protein YgcG
MLAAVFGSLALAGALAYASAPADEGWVIERMHVGMTIQPDGRVETVERLDVDFRGLEKHGIFRDITYLQIFDGEHNRRYDIRLREVTNAAGRAHQVQTSTDGDRMRFRIGDPDRTLSGRETYRIAYTLIGALNGFADHDELYWNASGTWPVSVQALTVEVATPGDAVQRVDCFQGRGGSTERCRAEFTPGRAVFTATRPLVEGEQMTIVAGLRKGAAAEPAPLLVRRPRGITEFFETTPAIIGGLWIGLFAAIGGLGGLWWRYGRDRRFITDQYLGTGTAEERVPLFGARPIGVEFQPPENLRPAQMGLIVDERADTLDVTATIVDLAVRGYLKIAEIPKSWILGSKDWELERLPKSDGDLLDYERTILNGLFKTNTTRKLSALKNSFYKDLVLAKKALYKDAIGRGWFRRSPETVRTVSRIAGIVVLVGGIFLIFQLGAQWGAGLLGLPVIAAGFLLAVFARAMPRRTAAGREALRRTLGFSKYVRTAETQPQEFAERANIFTSYLPYAVAFKCVEKWARAFKDIDMQAATAGWYAGTTTFDPGSFSSSLSSLSSSVSSTISSTPGGSGGSGFSGGSSGGGGGGGGGGSW